MSAKFQSDVFHSHSAKDKAGARLLAELLRLDGLRMWFDDDGLGCRRSLEIRAPREARNEILAASYSENT